MIKKEVDSMRTCVRRSFVGKHCVSVCILLGTSNPYLCQATLYLKDIESHTNNGISFLKFSIAFVGSSAHFFSLSPLLSLSIFTVLIIELVHVCI